MFQLPSLLSLLFFSFHFISSTDQIKTQNLVFLLDLPQADLYTEGFEHLFMYVVVYDYILIMILTIDTYS
ncbi:hypothetical protein QVD17_37485 [Tagetes erecta]|uniref:Uncharacterized protein n=1 Tax=Tagetes erecta TaxID=13708 RepID=A0AAD8NJ83_TARER|nr:hypothetical protein QVD17_37485 [Tagetes erecta]